MLDSNLRLPTQPQLHGVNHVAGEDAVAVVEDVDVDVGDRVVVAES